MNTKSANPINKVIVNFLGKLMTGNFILKGVSNMKFNINRKLEYILHLYTLQKPE